MVGVLDGLGIERAALVGHSVGCMVAERAAVDLGRRARALAVCGGALTWRPEAGPVFEERVRQARAGRMDEIAEVVDVASPLNASQTGNREPKTFMGGQLSTPYSVALVLTGRGAGFSQYLNGIQDAEVLAAARKVEMVQEPKFGETGRRVELTVKLVDGRSFSSAVELPYGEPENPLSKEALLESEVSGIALFWFILPAKKSGVRSQK
jgi:pimeloyl-ACP methyl ester carboxylesterase